MLALRLIISNSSVKDRLVPAITNIIYIMGKLFCLLVLALALKQTIGAIPLQPSSQVDAPRPKKKGLKGFIWKIKKIIKGKPKRATSEGHPPQANLQRPESQSVAIIPSSSEIRPRPYIAAMPPVTQMPLRRSGSSQQFAVSATPEPIRRSSSVRRSSSGDILLLDPQRESASFVKKSPSNRSLNATPPPDRSSVVLSTTNASRVVHLPQYETPAIYPTVVNNPAFAAQDPQPSTPRISSPQALPVTAHEIQSPPKKKKSFWKRITSPFKRKKSKRPSQNAEEASTDIFSQKFSSSKKKSSSKLVKEGKSGDGSKPEGQQGIFVRIWFWIKDIFTCNFTRLCVFLEKPMNAIRKVINYFFERDVRKKRNEDKKLIKQTRKAYEEVQKYETNLVENYYQQAVKLNDNLEKVRLQSL